jgi:hypothetical protein
MIANHNNLSHLDIRVLKTNTLTSIDRERVHLLFDFTYRQANHEYLENSLLKLRYLALATDRDEPVGFALADMLEAPLPRLPDPQTIMLAGICCVAVDFRRLGLFTKLEILASHESGLFKPDKRILMCGRMAHPVSFRTIRKSPTVVPRPGVAISYLLGVIAWGQVLQSYIYCNPIFKNLNSRAPDNYRLLSCFPR